MSRPSNRLRSIHKMLHHVTIDLLAIKERIQHPVSGSPKPALHILLFHHLYDNEVDRFRKLLIHLKEHYTFIPYFEAVRRIKNNTIEKPYLTISFDGGLKNSLAAARIMSELDISSCFFISPTMIEEEDPALIAQFCRQRLGIAPAKFLSWGDIQTMLLWGHEFGSHTLSHRNLAELSPTEIEDEIFTSQLQLSKHVGKVKHFAWPYGRKDHFNTAAAQAVMKAGFLSCASSLRGSYPVSHLAASDSKSNQKQDPLIYLWRERIEANCPSRHIDFVLSKSRRLPKKNDANWPEHWSKNSD